jgi:hypothetical protein
VDGGELIARETVDIGVNVLALFGNRFCLVSVHGYFRGVA